MDGYTPGLYEVGQLPLFSDMSQAYSGIRTELGILVTDPGLQAKRVEYVSRLPDLPDNGDNDKWRHLRVAETVIMGGRRQAEDPLARSLAELHRMAVTFREVDEDEEMARRADGWAEEIRLERAKRLGAKLLTAANYLDQLQDGLWVSVGSGGEPMVGSNATGVWVAPVRGLQRLPAEQEMDVPRALAVALGRDGQPRAVESTEAIYYDPKVV